MVSENNKPTELVKINFVDKISKAMDNLHVRPNFNLSKENHHSCTKRIVIKLVKLQNFVMKCCKARKICMVLQSLQIMYILALRAEIVTIFGSKMVTISARIIQT